MPRLRSAGRFALAAALAVACSSAVLAAPAPPAPPLPPPAPPAAPPPAVATTAPDRDALEARLERLAERLEQRRRDLNVPGMAIAVVKDDAVVLARGFGVADVETERPVTPETLFAIGSSTKAFTATLIGMLVDEGEMTWDDPVTKHLPWFTPQPDTGEAGAEILIRDMLAHRTGFARMGILWAGGAVPREDVLRAAAKAEPWAKFREGFNYCNIMYLAAGMAAGAASGSDWDALLRDRLLEPLGMSSSNTSVRASRSDPRLALGYRWDEDLGAFKRLPMRELDTIAPAGAINSNVLDMAQWVRFLLAHGEHDGRRLVSTAALEETWTSHVTVGGGVGYGLGWMVREWEGRRVVEHGGNIDGFAAEVALLPDDGVGFVLLTNVTATPLQQASLELVWKVLLGPAEDDAVAAAEGGEELAPYLGTYVANFGPFRNQDFTVLVQNDRLAVDVPGQMVYELNVPGEDGKRAFAITDAIAVSFDRDEGGRVVGMKMYQAGMEFELPRTGVAVAGEMDVAELQRYLGTYRSDELDADVEVLVQSGRLALDVPRQMVFELHPPDAEGRWVFRVTKDVAVTFAEDDGGRVESLTMHQTGRTFLMPRTRAGGAEPSRTLEEILALRDSDGRRAALHELGVFRLRGRVRMANSGVDGTLVVYGAGADRFRQETDFGVYGRSSLAVRADGGSAASTFAPFDELSGRYLEQARISHPAALHADWREFFDEITVLPDAGLDGRTVLVVRLQRGDVPVQTVRLDPDTGDVLELETMALMPGIGGLPVRARFEDYRDVHGLRLPFKATVTNDAVGRSIAEMDDVAAHLVVDEDLFVLSATED